jgi:hypothetical protein
MTYEFPLLDQTGNFPVKVRVKLSLVDQDGIHEVGFCAQVCISLWCVRNRRFRGGPYVLASLVHVAVAVAGVSFKCLWIASSVRPGHVIRCPSLTACNNADFVGLNRALCN